MPEFVKKSSFIIIIRYKRVNRPAALRAGDLLPSSHAGVARGVCFAPLSLPFQP